jgi:hypothetical protein
MCPNDAIDLFVSAIDSAAVAEDAGDPAGELAALRDAIGAAAALIAWQSRGVYVDRAALELVICP